MVDTTEKVERLKDEKAKQYVKIYYGNIKGEELVHPEFKM